MTDLIKRLRDFGHVDAYQAADRIEELVEERDIARRLLGAATQMQIETQAQLNKAVEALRKIAGNKHFSWDQGWIQNTEARIARAVLAELGKE